MSGCSRTRYRQNADKDAYYLIGQKSFDPRWTAEGFTLDMDPRSRYFDPYNPDCSPMPQDDPASHRYMVCIDGKKSWRYWHANGDRRELENPDWRQQLFQYNDMDENGAIKMDVNKAVDLAYMHSPTWRTQLETLYLSALDVSAERFSFQTQFFAGTGPTFTHNGRLRSFAGETNTLQVNSDAQMRKRFATGGTLLVGFANAFVWQFAGPNTNQTNSLINFTLQQPLLQAGGRVIALEQLTIAERVLLANLRALAQYRQAFYTNIAVGDQGQIQGPQRRGGFFGGTGLTGFTGQGSGGFGGVGSAGNFGFFGGQGGAAGAQGAGIAGGGAGTVGGLIGLAQTAQEIRNAEDNLALETRTLDLLIANQEAGLIDITQVDIFRQTVETDKATLLQSRYGLQNSIETFVRTSLGLPPNLAFTLDDTIVRQFQFVDRRMTAAQNRFLDFRKPLGDAEEPLSVEQLQAALEELARMRLEGLEQFAAVRADLKKLETESARREKNMAPEEVPTFRSEKQALYAALEDIFKRYQLTEEALRNLGEELKPETVGRVTTGIVALAGALSDLIQEASLVQARARLETVDVDPIKLSNEDALAIARANRMDWMNNRASLVDTWRLIQFNANSLRSGLTVTVSGDAGTVGNNPLRFNAATGTLRAGVRFDAPITRLLQRNNYRSALISYQSSRRGLIQFEDQINQTLRQDLRQLENLRQNLQIQRRAVAIAVRRVDQTREDLNEPPPPSEPGQPAQALGPTAAQNLVNALQSLRTSQNNFQSVWLNYYAGRMALMRDLGIMKVDDRGYWIDESLEEALSSLQRGCGDSYTMPPSVTSEMFEEMGVDPRQYGLPSSQSPNAGESVPPGEGPIADEAPTPGVGETPTLPAPDQGTMNRSGYGPTGGYRQPYMPPGVDEPSWHEKIWNGIFEDDTKNAKPEPVIARPEAAPGGPRFR